MISRLTATAATFAVLATASLTFAAELRHDVQWPQAGRPEPTAPKVVQLERVVITVKRTEQAPQ